MDGGAVDIGNEPNRRDDRSAGERLAREIRLRRTLSGLNQAALARKVGYSVEYVSRAQRPNKGLPSGDLVLAIDRAVAADGALVALHADAVAEQHARRPSRPTRSAAADVVTSAVVGAGTDASASGWSFQGGGSAVTGTVVAAAPAGRLFAGTNLPATACPASDDGRIVATLPAHDEDRRGLGRSGRGLVVGLIQRGERSEAYAVDRRVAAGKLRGQLDDRSAPRLVIPRAYRLDDLTLGLLWAAANMDASLLDDDRVMSTSRADVDPYERVSRSAVGRELVGDMAEISRMWVGSDFCARHVLRNTAGFGGTPTFWTREQRGEEASTWLLFAHKLAYLERTAGAGRGDAVARVFCVPRGAVEESPRAERVLLLLVAALMESFGIRTDVCDGPEYGGMQGFVLDGRRRAIVASWGGADSVWQVDVTDARPQVAEFADAAGHVRAHSVVAAPSPPQRLERLADYLGLDLAWLARRCAEMGEYGSTGILAPRSRLLSVSGVDRACTFIGELERRAA